MEALSFMLLMGVKTLVLIGIAIGVYALFSTLHTAAYRDSVQRRAYYKERKIRAKQQEELARLYQQEQQIKYPDEDEFRRRLTEGW